MKPLATAVLAAGIWIAGNVSAHDPIPVPTAKLENFVHWPESGTGILQSKIQGEALGLCNYSRVEIAAVTYNVTAGHCMIWFPKWWLYDIVAIQNFTNFYREMGHSSISYHSLTEQPSVRRISEYSADTIWNKPLTAVGCFTDTPTERMFCYKIEWIPYVRMDGLVILFITNSDHERILSKDSQSRRTRIQSMSWWPVFDAEWKLFWVVSMNTNKYEGLQRKYGHSFIYIEPIRGFDGRIIPRLRR